jgi:hypothetical protein
MLKPRFDETMKGHLKTLSRSKPTLKCPKHTKYNPAHGRGKITPAHCTGCLAALEAYEAFIGLRQAVAKYLTLMEPYETAKPRQKRLPVTTGSPQLTSALTYLLKN